MFSAVWLQSSFSITSWLVGTRAMRAASAVACARELGVGHDLEDEADLAPPRRAGISSPVSR